MKFLCAAVVFVSAILVGCGKASVEVSANAASTGPGEAPVEADLDASNFKVDHPEQFALAIVGMRMATPELSVTGVVGPDVSRQVPVPSLASGKIIEISARLGDEVAKGQLLFKIRSSDIAGAYSDYQKAIKNEKLAEDNERLAKIQQQRAHSLYENGAIPKSALEVADNAEIAAQTGLENAKVDTETTTERLKLLGSDPEHPSGIVEVAAPVSGVITDQQITEGAGIQALAPPNPFTISDMSHVWILCDVYENNLAQVRLGDYADVRLNAYPDQVLQARVNNIGQIMDPNLHTAKVRLEVENPPVPGGRNQNGPGGRFQKLLRIGMFVTATFHGEEAQKRATVPATAVLHLHDRDWVYVAKAGGYFGRVEVIGGKIVPDGIQEVISGLKPGDRVVADALVLQSTVEQ